MSDHPRRARRGFTLIEVAFVVVLGLIILTGTITAYNANKAQAAGAAARKRVQVAQTVIEEFAATNGVAPTSGSSQFSTMWAAKHPDEAVVSPWGGTPGNPTQGATEDPPWLDGAPDAATAPDKSGSVAVDGTRQSNLHYTSVANGGWVKLTTAYTGDVRVVKGYALSIYDNLGNPWFEVAGSAR